MEEVGEEIETVDMVEVQPEWGIVRSTVGPFQTFHFYPHKTRGEGFFVAIARKSSEAGDRPRTPKARRSVIAAVDRQTREELSRWVAEPEKMHFALVADTCYGWYAATATAVKSLSEALPVIYSGVAMGQLFKGRLKPDPALAFFTGLNRQAVAVADLTDEAALQYLRKQEIAADDFTEGMNLVCNRGLALGFAKRIGNRINNMYPNSLRILMK